ncbi:hypothetical protein WK57_30615 [Burkholderia ubonensis]|uniref:Uncharacterized protein n=1 Tax=Burkholderia ubonensis TaxID=101571 RepID=A0AA40R578_9BURK|nr:hypothetical protein WK57_30615 [Burkholderia ubonensis]
MLFRQVMRQRLGMASSLILCRESLFTVNTLLGGREITMVDMNNLCRPSALGKRHSIEPVLVITHAKAILIHSRLRPIFRRILA